MSPFPPRLLVPAILLVLGSPAQGRVWVVHPDGSGDAPTIEAAIDSLAEPDVIELADGLYTGAGNRDLNNQEKAVVIRSQSGDPSACVIDVQGSEGEPHDFIAFWGGG